MWITKKEGGAPWILGTLSGRWRKRRGYGQDIEFEALQDIAIGWSVRCRIIGNSSDDLDAFYAWYSDRLIKIHDKVFEEIKRLRDLGPTYHRQARGVEWKMNATLVKIRAVLDSWPEITRS